MQHGQSGLLVPGPPPRSAKIRLDDSVCWCMDRLVRAGARPLLRVLLGRWPDPLDLRDFRAAHTAGGHLPRILHALSTMGCAQRMLTAAALESWLPVPVQGATGGLALTSRPHAAFMHIEKTGGTSVQHFLLAQYHPVQAHTPAAPGEAGQAHSLHGPLAEGRALVYGHFDLPSLRAARPERLVFTFLRDPQARILSLYRYWCAAGPGSAAAARDPAVRAAMRLDLLGFLRCPEPAVRNAIDNTYARRLTGWGAQADADPLRADPHGALTLAQASLDTLCCVGITEHLADSLQVLARCLNLTPPAAAPVENAGADNAARLPRHFRAVAAEPVTPAITAELERLTALDQVLYDQGRRRLAACLEGVDAC